LHPATHRPEFFLAIAQSLPNSSLAHQDKRVRVPHESGGCPIFAAFFAAKVGILTRPVLYVRKKPTKKAAHKAALQLLTRLSFRPR
jgi:hypothetical protein